jgi:hypothetical protein
LEASVRYLQEAIMRNTAPRRDNAVREHGGVSKTNNTSSRDITATIASVKAKLLAGQFVRQIDYPEAERSAVIAAMATLRDELPIRCRWTTIRESHLSETRLRAKSYSIDGSFLRGEGVSHD